MPEATLAPLRARVEAARGLPFRRPVRALTVREDQVEALLGAELDRTLPPDERAREQALATGLGILPAGVDLRLALLAFTAKSVAGFYSPREGRLYVVEGAAAAAGGGGEDVLVHELAHALQDQHSELLGVLLGITDNGDLGFALSALLEGEATYVERADAAQATGSDRISPAALGALFRADPPAADGPPLFVRETIVRVYPLGYALADALARSGGERALDAALADPPLSSEQLLHPERYLDPALRAPLVLLPTAAAAPGCAQLGSNSYGELGVQVWLRETGLVEGAAAVAADGWDGDRAWRFACDGDPRVAWLVQLSDEREANELDAAFRSRLEWRGDLALRADRAGARVLLSAGVPESERARLLALPEAGRAASLAAYLAAHPEVRARARAARR